MRTAYDSLSAKHSALQVGYQPVKDNPTVYANLLQTVASETTNRKRQSPLVNAGYAARIAVVTSTISSFIKFHESGACTEKLQLVVLGCGLDLTSLWAHSLCPTRITVFEIDTEEICLEKRKILIANGLVQTTNPEDGSALSAGLIFFASIVHNDCDMSTNYSLQSCDLREKQQLQQALSGVDTTLPTLVISEIVMAYLGRAGVDDVAKYVSEHLCVAPTSVFVAYEPLGPIQHNYQHQQSVIEGYKAQYYQQFVDKLERGLAKSSVDDVFHPLGSSHQNVETRLERCGFGFAKACLAGQAATCWIRLTAPEPFDEHAALALHLHSYALAVSFSFHVPLNLVRAMCPWSNATMQDRAPTAIQINDGSSIIMSPIEVRDQQVVQDLFVHTYEDLSSDLKAVRKMVKMAIKSDLQASDSDPCIARKYAMWGGIFLVALGEREGRTVIGCIGVRLCQSRESFLSMGLMCFEVNRLLVDLSSRGKGIGKSLLQACHRFIESEVGPDTPYAVIATTPQLLKAANALYSSFGYSLEKEEKLGGVVLNTYIYCKNELPS